MSDRLRAQYPDEMTIILQHQFWDLKVGDEDFEVGLSFGGVPERLTVPFEAINGFFDPSVQFGLQFEEVTEGDERPAPANVQEPPAIARKNVCRRRQPQLPLRPRPRQDTTRPSAPVSNAKSRKNRSRSAVVEKSSDLIVSARNNLPSSRFSTNFFCVIGLASPDHRFGGMDHPWPKHARNPPKRGSKATLSDLSKFLPTGFGARKRTVAA